MTEAQKLTVAQVAKMAKVKPQTIRCYQCRGTIPPPTGYFGKSPYWSKQVIVRWIARRPGIGRPVGS